VSIGVAAVVHCQEAGGVILPRLQQYPLIRSVEILVMPLIKTLKEDENEVETWEILEAGIPRGSVTSLARKLHLSEDLIRRWRRQPEGSENPNATGKMNPFDRFLIVLEHMAVNSPAAAEMAIDMQRRLVSRLIGEEERARCAKECFREMVRESSEVIQAAGTDAALDEIEREIAEAKAAMDEFLRQKRREKGLRQVS
jgi:hypothetical protein